MDMFLGALAFTLMIAAQLLAVVAVHNVRRRSESRQTEPAEQRETPAETRVRHIWLIGG